MAEIVVSRRTFLIGLVIAILAASLISTVISTQLVAVGPQGPKGEKGDVGDTGPRGIAGTDGADGNDGVNGTDGIDGLDGKSAYQIWLDQGNSGTEQDFLDSLKGEQGPPVAFTIGNMSGWLPAPAYDSGWINVTNYWFPLWHGLNTTEVLVYAIRNDSEYGINQMTPAGATFSLEWLLLSENEIVVRIAQITPRPTYDKVRVMLWKISEP